MSHKDLSLNPSKESNTTYSHTPTEENPFFIPHPAPLALVEHSVDEISESTKPNPKMAILVDASEAFGSRIETKLLEIATPSETPKIVTPSENPKELGSPTL